MNKICNIQLKMYKSVRHRDMRKKCSDHYYEKFNNQGFENKLVGDREVKTAASISLIN